MSEQTEIRHTAKKIISGSKYGFQDMPPQSYIQSMSSWKY